jgi:hypothetical protein
MLKIVLEFIIIVCGIITLVALVMLIRESLTTRKIYNLTLSDLPVKKTTLCQLIIEWCHENLANPNTLKPNLILKYNHHKNLAGVYFSSSHECHIYIQNHQTLREITNTVIHEYVHSRQKTKDFDKMYDRYQKQLGYEQNPFEAEAISVAKNYERECMIWVCYQIQSS